MDDSTATVSEPPTVDIDRETFREHAGSSADRSDRPTVVRTVATLDVETTPLAAYAALTGRTAASDRERAPYAFLLESAEKTASSDPDGAFRPSAADAERHARYSYVGYDPEAVVTVESGEATVEALSEDAPLAAMQSEADGDTVDALRTAMPDVRLANMPDHDRQHLEGGLVGFLAYDAVYDLWLEEVGCERPNSRFPDAQFLLTTKTLAFDERDGTLSLVFTPVLEADDDPDEEYTTRSGTKPLRWRRRCARPSGPRQAGSSATTRSRVRRRTTRKASAEPKSTSSTGTSIRASSPGRESCTVMSTRSASTRPCGT